MDLHLLELLIAFKKHGTLSETSEALHMTQPTLSRSMQRLEKEINVPVFIHGKNSLKLNENGEYLVAQSEKLLQNYEDILQHLRVMDISKRTIRIGHSAPGPAIIFDPVLHDLYPKSSIIWESVESEEALLEGLHKHVYDFVFVQKQKVPSDLYSLSCLKEQLYVCIPEGHPFSKHKAGITFEQMDGNTYLQIEDVGIWRKVKQHNMPHSQIILQKDRKDLMKLIQNSSLPCFVSNLSPTAYKEQMQRISIPITDSSASITFMFVITKKDRQRFFNLISAIKDKKISY